MSELNAVVAVYGTHTEAEEAVKELQRAGVDMHSRGRGRESQERDRRHTASQSYRACR